MFWHQDNDQGTLPVSREQNYTAESKYRTSFHWSGEVVYINNSNIYKAKVIANPSTPSWLNETKVLRHQYLQKSCLDSQKSPKSIFQIWVRLYDLCGPMRRARNCWASGTQPELSNRLIALLIFQGGKHDPGSMFWCVLLSFNSNWDDVSPKEKALPLL